jgi:NADH dehydrogenase FAD-containing subunit
LESEIKNASSVLVVGTGATGLEVAGILEEKFGNEKQIGLMSRGNKLLSVYNSQA